MITHYRLTLGSKTCSYDYQIPFGDLIIHKIDSASRDENVFRSGQEDQNFKLVQTMSLDNKN